MSVLALLLLAATPADWVPARWPSTDLKSLELLDRSPVDCLVLDSDAPEAFRSAAASRKIAVVRLGRDVPLYPRNKLPLDSRQPVIATEQAVWPGINLSEEETQAMPSGAPWIDTNAGFLRFSRAASRSRVWIANRPPANKVIPVERYLQAIADSASLGARWVIAFDDDYSKRLLARDFKAFADWERINTLLRFYENHREWESYQPGGQMAVIQDVAGGGLLSGSILDMVATRHTPVRAVPSDAMSKESFQGVRMAVNADPSRLTAQQKSSVADFAKSGGSVLTAPPGWTMPSPRDDQVTLDKTDVQKLDEIWKEVNGMIGRGRNLGIRLFNVSSMLSDLTRSPDGTRVALQLVNYSNYPAEDITGHLVGKFRKATLYTPEGPPRDLPLFEVDDGTGVEIPKISVAATVVFETMKP